MPFKCSVVHCHSGYSNGPSEVMFAFPKQDELRQKWVKFLNREPFTITPSSRICIQHFEVKYIIPHPLKTRLNMKLNPIPTIYPSSIPKSQQVLISPPIRKKPPQKIRPRRVSPHWEHEISRQLEEMLSANPPICQPSKSPWASDVVLVKRKDGNMRFAIDYPRLNAVTKRDEYSLPNPQSIFDRLEGSKYFSKLDVASAYWTIPILPKDVEKTAFHTPRGMYEMLVMPFGLCIPPATFQKVMDRILDKAPHCESYVDDILIFSPSFESHLEHLRDVFKRLDVAGLQLRRDKCRIGYSSVEFLGHRISFEGRAPISGYIQKLQSFPQPKSVPELQRFLGTANYYRCT